MIYLRGALEISGRVFDVCQATNLLIVAVRRASAPDATKEDRDAVEGSRKTLSNTIAELTRFVNVLSKEDSL